MSPPAASAPDGLTRFLDLREELVEHGWRDGADRELGAVLRDAVIELAGEPPPGTALAAIGGFGRGRQAIRSDVDLFFLHGPDGAEALTRRVLRPLWDAGLKVGHLTHTPKDARVFAGTRLDAISTFLTARFLVGEEGLFADFRTRFARLLEKEYLRIVAGMADEERRRRTREPYRLMASDLKTGRGGIRTLDMLDWRRRLQEAGGAEPPPETPDETAARDTLMRARSALHAVTGRLHDTYDFEVRSAAAGWLGTEVTRLGRDILGARRAAEELVSESWPEVVGKGGRATALERRDDLLALTRPEARTEFHRHAAAGAVDPLFPEWRELEIQPHLVAFHRYPVGDHILAALDQAWRLVDGAGDDPLSTEALTDLHHPELVVWAALLHDVGKVLEGDHSRAGSVRARLLATDLGFSDEHVDLLARVVEHHLLLPDLATRFDIDDPGVLARASDLVGDHTTLRVLYLLTVADSRATGSDTWNAWRAELLRRAYRRLERELSRRSLPESARVAVLADRVMDVSDGLDRSEVVAHLAGLGEVYRSSHTPETIRDHVLLARRLDPGGVAIEVVEGAPTRIDLVTADRPGLLRAVSGTLALHRMSVVDARFATRSDGRVFDTFEVVDVDGGTVDHRRLSGFESDLGRVVRGSFDLESALAEKQHAYRHATRSGVTPVIRVVPAAGGGGRVDVECADRLGLLHDLATAFAELGVGVLRARIDTAAGVAYDSFFVERLPADPETVERALLGKIA